MSLVFSNCKLYNGVENYAGKIGITIETEYNRLLDMYNFHKRFQNSPQIHPSIMITQKLKKKSQKNDEQKKPNQEKENLINKESSLSQKNIKELSQGKGSADIEQLTFNSSVSLLKKENTMTEDKNNEESTDKGKHQYDSIIRKVEEFKQSEESSLLKSEQHIIKQKEQHSSEDSLLDENNEQKDVSSEVNN